MVLFGASHPGAVLVPTWRDGAEVGNRSSDFGWKVTVLQFTSSQPTPASNDTHPSSPHLPAYCVAQFGLQAIALFLCPSGRNGFAELLYAVACYYMHERKGQGCNQNNRT